MISPCCGRYTPLITFSIELLPAPLGPMIARISCSRTLKEISVSALTPPKDSEILRRSRITSPILRAVVIFAFMSGCFLQYREGFYIDDAQIRRDHALAAVF